MGLRRGRALGVPRDFAEVGPRGAHGDVPEIGLQDPMGLIICCFIYYFTKAEACACASTWRSLRRRLGLTPADATTTVRRAMRRRLGVTPADATAGDCEAAGRARTQRAGCV